MAEKKQMELATAIAAVTQGIVAANLSSALITQRKIKDPAKAVELYLDVVKEIHGQALKSRKT